jgi:SAM-dependent methyltransferase
MMLPLYTERLGDIAAQAYELANQLCGSCRDLHALWPYIRLSRSSTGVELEGSQLIQVLRELMADGRRNVLIAGAADTGLLALVARAAADQATSHPTNIVVIDICETPLELCRRSAAAWSLPIKTMRQDLIELDIRQQFDLVLVHGTLHFMTPLERVTALSAIQRAMRRGGRLVLLFNTSEPPTGEAEDKIHIDYATAVLSELKRQHVVLPDSEAALRERLAAHSRRRQLREGAFRQPSDVTPLLEAAGLNVISCDEIDAGLSSGMRNFVSRISKRRFMALCEPKR